MHLGTLLRPFCISKYHKEYGKVRRESTDTGIGRKNVIDALMDNDERRTYLKIVLIEQYRRSDFSNMRM